MKILRGDAPAKLNLFLKVTGRRPDGYHTLETVFQQVALCDNMSLTVHGRGGISVRTNKRFLPTDGRNLAVRAAQAFFEASGAHNTGLYINIKKNIPVGGGMAGGSTNAAAVLDMLNRAHGRPLDAGRMHSLALSLGADVPFCLRGGAALATGIGEVLRPVAPIPRCALVLCRPPVSVSTKVAYGLLDDWPREAGRPEASAMVEALTAGSLEAVCAALYNDFEGPIMARWPELGALKTWFLEDGALGAMMTGTGSVVFGVYPDEAPAHRAAERLRGRYSEVFLTAPE